MGEGLERKTNATPITSAQEAQAALRAFASEMRARVSQRFFKTGPGEYGEGDRFLGVSVPSTRTIARRAHGLAESELDALLASPWHEERLLALLVLVRRYEKGSRDEREAALRHYRARIARVNSWDLVDLSAWQILGRALRHENPGKRVPKELVELTESPNLWERRIAMVATFAWTKERTPEVACAIAERLLDDREDLVHKAVGWMLREVGKRASRRALAAFLETHADHMPRTALRYALEHFEPAERARFLSRGRSALRKAP